MSDDYELNVRMTGDSSGFEDAINNAENATQNFSDKLNNLTDDVTDGAKNWGIDLDKFYNKGSSLFKNFGFDIDKLAEKFGINGKLLVAIASCVIALEKFGEKIQAMSSEIAKGTGATGKELLKLKDTANDALVMGVGRSAQEVGSMIADLNTRFGFTGETLAKMTDQFDKFAKITGTDVTTSINSVADTVYKWGLDVEQTEGVMNQLVVASQMSGASIDELTNGLKSGQAVFSQFGMSLTDSIAFESALAKQGIDTTQAIFGMRTALAKFSKEGKDASVAYSEVSEAIKNAKTETEAMSIAVETFGTRSGPEMVKVLRNSSISADDFKKSLMEAGTAIEDTENASRTVSDAMNDLKGVFTGTFGGLGEGLANLFRDIIDSITLLVQGIEPVLRPIFDIVGEIFTFVGAVIKTIIQNFVEFHNRFNFIFQSIAKILNDVKKFFREVFGDLLSIIQNVFGLIFDIIGGKWELAWERTKNILMRVVKIILDFISLILKGFQDMINGIVKAINKIIEPLDKLNEFLGWRQVGLIEEWDTDLDLAKISGLTEAIEKSDEKIQELSGKTAEKLVGDIGSVSDTTVETTEMTMDEVTSIVTEESEKQTDEINKQLEERLKFQNSWADKLFKSKLQEIEDEYALETGKADFDKLSTGERIAIHQKYLNERLSAYKDAVEKERDLEIQKAYDVEADGMTIARINKYYDDKIADYKLKSTTETNKKIQEENEKGLKKITDGVQKVFKNIKTVAKNFASIFSKIIDLNLDDLLDGILEFEDKILTFFLDTLPKIPEYFAMILESIIHLFTTIADNPDFVKNIVDMVIKIANLLIDNFPVLFDAVLQITVQLVVELIKRLPEIVQMLLKGISTVIQTLAKGIWDLLVKAFNAIGSGFSKMWSWIGDKLGWWATGVNNAPSGLAVVGEQGPELVDFKGGERVYNNSDTRKILSGANSSGGNNFNIVFNNTADTSAYQMMRQLKDYNRQMAINGVI